MPPLRTLIVDDEPLARAGLSDYLGRLDWLEEAGQCANGLEALDFLGERDVDLLLLDIQMPGLGGLDLLRTLDRPPAVILTTAHPDFALEGFELDVVDYLLKPIAFPRFLKAVLRVRDKRDVTLSPAPAAPPRGPAPPIFIKQDGRTLKVQPADIRYVESVENYCKIHLAGRTLLPLVPLKDLLAALPEGEFMQVHRSYAVNLRYVTALEGNQLVVEGAYVPVSRSRRGEVRERVVGDRLL